MIGSRRRAITLAATAGLVVGTAVTAATVTQAGAATPGRNMHPGYVVKGAVPASQGVSVSVAIPLRHQHALHKLLAAQTRAGSANYHKWLTPGQFQHRFGVTSTRLHALQHKLAGHHVAVTRLGAQAIRVTGSSSAVAKLFSTTFKQVRTKGTSDIRTAAMSKMKSPTPIAALGGRAIDLSPAIRLQSNASTIKHNRYGQYGTYWTTDLKQAYKYPAYGDSPSAGKVAGKGQTIGLLMSNAPSQADLNQYFAHEGMTAPTIDIENVDGGAPFDPNGSFESNLDVQQSAGTAPNASIRFYNMPDLSDESVFSGYVQIDEDNAVDEVSSSFGGCELFYTPAYNGGTSYTGILKSYHALFQQGNAQGITFMASSGDSGALGCTNPGYLTGQTDGNTFVPGVEWPADDPNVTAVGGTNLQTTYKKGSLESKYIGENAGSDTEVPYDPYGEGADVSGGVWGSGGGTSVVFKAPSWQTAYAGNSTGYRTVPDVSLHMGGCPGGISAHCNPVDTADVEVLAGSLVGVIGTSASSPDFAGTVALYNEAHGIQRSGNINATIYKMAAAQRSGKLGFNAFHTKIPGDNGYYVTAWTASGGTHSGYDEVLGNGTLVAKNFIFGNPDTPAAGNPQTPSNP